ncbi:2Fe-2S iron-sulfur cluster-binding protein [Flavobacterium taihuense]|uniref:2Fe-2S iron-sulfur cluster binding domain-containing protein n=1 Tax=Flavobacterium taihuense TaxID=2857508 RepID=A0ABS6XSL4_9FLAO|nr:2Fe-2S iron-sulfur cluster-binding protein [Flavobacterium taihuense]MBW4359663.1 2Fe-2S iron-sulfur cluster binding domain-containing protein [Flavobacterium taihuense]
MKNSIQFTVIEDGQNQQIETFHGAYPNLMYLLKDKLFLNSFGECGGMGKCATCIVKTTGIKGNSVTKDRNEPNTLIKLGHTEENIRLSCQLFITQDLEGAQIEILENIF